MLGGNRVLVASERTNELAYPATLVLNPLSPGREVTEAMPEGIEHSLPVNLPVSLLGERKVGMRGIPSPRISGGGPTAPYLPNHPLS